MPKYRIRGAYSCFTTPKVIVMGSKKYTDNCYIIVTYLQNVAVSRTTDVIHHVVDIFKYIYISQYILYIFFFTLSRETHAK